MTEFSKIFDTVRAVTVQEILAFAALIVPGFISLRVYELRSGGESRKVNEALIDVVIYSFATDVIAYAGLAFLTLFVPEPKRGVASAMFSVIVFLVVPVAFGLLLYEFQQRMIRSGFVPDTRTKPWDRILDRVAKGRADLGVILTLRDGRKIGGRLSRPGLSSRAAGDEIMVGEVWTIDEQRATFVEAVEGSFGVLVGRAECETIELFRWADVAPRSAAHNRSIGEIE